MKSKPEIVLKALLHGLPVTINGSEYVLSDDNELCVRTQFYTTLPDTGTAEERKHGYNYLKAEYTIRQFINLSHRLSDDEAFLLSSDIALNEIKKERERNRRKRT